MEAPGARSDALVARIKDELLAQKQSMRPWGDFVKGLKLPQSAPQAIARLQYNIVHFRSNYVLITIALAIYTLLTSPLLLVVLGLYIFAYLYVSSAESAGRNIVIFGQTLSKSQQIAVATVVGVPLFFLSGAISSFFWLLGLAATTVGAHAVLAAEANTALLPTSSS
eukprot:m.74431 g.74431  ORF g.74431 m.74431 type:complete len:167 (-) comp50338_c0_seq1:135-635(-)